MYIKKRERKTQNKLTLTDLEPNQTSDPTQTPTTSNPKPETPPKPLLQFNYKSTLRSDPSLNRKVPVSTENKDEKAKKTYLTSKFCESKPPQQNVENTLKTLDEEIEALNKLDRNDKSIEGKEKDKIDELIELQQRVVKENEEKPFWIGGIIEIDVPVEKRIHNIEDCDNLIDKELVKRIARVIKKEKRELIPGENFIAKGSIWAKPKKIVKQEDRERKRILKSYLNKFKYRR